MYFTTVYTWVWCLHNFNKLFHVGSFSSSSSVPASMIVVSFVASCASASRMVLNANIWKATRIAVAKKNEILLLADDDDDDDDDDVDILIVLAFRCLVLVIWSTFYCCCVLTYFIHFIESNRGCLNRKSKIEINYSNQPSSM